MPTTMSRIMPPPPPVRRLATKPARPPKMIHARILMVEPPTEIELSVEPLHVLPRIRDRGVVRLRHPTCRIDTDAGRRGRLHHCHLPATDPAACQPAGSPA